MSINLSFENNLFALNKLQLPTRYYYFDGKQNYIKLLSIGEGIFPKDKIRTYIKLQASDSVFTTESATKVYPTKKEFGINQVIIELENSNMEFINDELILYKDAKFLQLLKIKADKYSTFFYGDILSHGRSYENFDFNMMSAKNSFYCDGDIEYLEKYHKSGRTLKKYLQKHDSKSSIFSKIYIKLNDNENFLKVLNKHDFHSFSYTSNQKMLIGVLSSNNMTSLKAKLSMIWELYRGELGKVKFNLGKP